MHAVVELAEAQETDRPASLRRGKDFPRQVESCRIQARVRAALEARLAPNESPGRAEAQKHLRPRRNVLVLDLENAGEHA
jgi:hypothetical protein